MDIPLWKNRSIVEPGSILQLYRLKLGLVNYTLYGLLQNNY